MEAMRPSPTTDDHAPDRGAPAGAARRRLLPPVGPIDAWIDGDLLRATGIRYACAERFGVPSPRSIMRGPRRPPAGPRRAPRPYDPMGDRLFSPLTRELEVDEHPQHLSVTAPADAPPMPSCP